MTDLPTTTAPPEEDETKLDALQSQLYLALRLKEKNQVDKAGELLRGILKEEPRLAEPRMELARILLDTGQLEEARAQAEEAVAILESGGQWTDEIPENVLASMALGLLGEIIRQQADADDVVFGDPEIWKEMTRASESAFAKAKELDPDNEHAGYWVSGTDRPTE